MHEASSSIWDWQGTSADAFISFNGTDVAIDILGYSHASVSDVVGKRCESKINTVAMQRVKK